MAISPRRTKVNPRTTENVSARRQIPGGFKVKDANGQSLLFAAS
jgi:hypothetical protein